MRILMRRCNRCSGCCAVNCGLCRECQDKPAFGGKGIRKKLCRARRCQNPQSAKAAAAKAANGDDSEYGLSANPLIAFGVIGGILALTGIIYCGVFMQKGDFVMGQSA